MTQNQVPQARTGKTILNAASGLVVHDGKVLLIRRGKEPYKGFWSLPGGGIEDGERLRDTVKREVFEETGLIVKVGKIAGLREVIRAPDHYLLPVFFCTIIGGELRAGDDATEAEFIAPSKLSDRLLVPAMMEVFRDAGLLESPESDPVLP